ncbi:MAG: hypothetical protein ACK504_00490 [Bacteroidota bacterium]
MIKKIIDFSIFSVIFFSAIILFKDPFEFQITYLAIIFLLPFFIFKYEPPSNILYIFFPLLIFGLINIYFENNTFSQFIKIYVNLLVGVLFFYYVFEYYDRDIKKIFGIYMNWSYASAIIGIFQLLSFWIGFKYGYDYRLIGFNKWGINLGGFGIRINGIFCEPSYLASTLGPAFFVCLYNLIFNKTHFATKKMSIIIIICYFISASTLAYIGIFVCLFLLLINFGFVRYIAFVVPLSLILFFYIYSNVNDFKLRMDGLKALYIEDIINTEGADVTMRGNSNNRERVKYLLSRVHGSSFIQYNNYWIAKNNFLQNPFFGTGLGSHEIAFEKYDLSPKFGNLYDGNKSDANSMLLRTISETGLFGVLFLFFFIKNNFVKNEGEEESNNLHWLISNAVLVIIILQLARQGNYTFGGFMAFLWLYYYTRKDYELLKENNDLELIQENSSEENNHKHILVNPTYKN